MTRASLLYHVTIIIVIQFLCSNTFAQQTKADTTYILPVIKKNVAEINSGAYSTNFDFTKKGDRKDDYQLVANSSAYMGAFLNYKWISLNYSTNIPGTLLDRNVKLQYTSFRFRFGSQRMIFNPFYESYNGLLIPKVHSNGFETFRGIQFTKTGFDYYYFTNTNRFSFKAAHGFSQLQLKSAGAFFLMITPKWQRIKWETPTPGLISDSSTYELLSSSPEWLSMIARAGYSYNFVIEKGKWIISPVLLIGGGGLKEINTNNKKLKAITDVQTWLHAGYNGPNYYIYVKGTWGNLQTNLFIKNMNQVNTDFSVTAGYRFQNLKRKIMGLL